MGGPFALIAGFVGLVGLAAMIANLRTTAADPLGIVIFAALLINGLVAVVRRATGRDRPRAKSGPLSGTRSRKRR
ncbi:MAG: hypothetical protein MAG453_01397 [Calditrichaeota bacterium]|nr:hypothetical protein [Calditrichota bacterium]